MKHVSVIVPAGESVLSSIVGAYKVFQKVNQYLIKSGQRKEDYFQVDLVGLNKETSLYGGLFTVHPNKTIHEIKKTDLIIVTTITGDMPAELERNAAFIPWIVKQHLQHQAEVASLCTGAFLLAATGLLDGKSCATHWVAAGAFKQLYPQVKLLGEKVISEDNGLYSSGGAYSFMNLLLYLVEKYNGREVAIWCAKLFEIDIDRDNQNHFMIFSGQKEHADESIRNAQVYVENNFSKKISVNELAIKYAISHRNFVRRFKKATDNTPLEYIQRVKVEAAKKTLETSSDNINQVMYGIGYNDHKAFRNLFKKYTGLSPLDYRNKYNLGSLPSKQSRANQLSNISPLKS